MQTVVAYRFARPRDAREIQIALRRVQEHYAVMAGGALTMRAVIGTQVGLAAFTGGERPISWPAWTFNGSRAAATVHVPFGWRQLLGDVPMEEAPLLLRDRLVADRDALVQLAPPFAILTLDLRSGLLDVLNDGLGYVRLYTTAEPDDLVVSSRPGAVPIFLGQRPTAALRGWQTSGAAGWFMGDATPLERVFHLDPGTHLSASGDRRKANRFDAIRAWTEPRGDAPPEQHTVVAGQLSDFASDVGDIWSIPPTVHLSGGRDSRAAAAGFVAQAVPARFRTVATLRGELDVAKELLGRVGRSADHVVIEERDTSITGDIRDRAAALHRAFDGVYGPGGLKQGLMRRFNQGGPTVTGAAGEIARGNFYKGAILEMVRSRGDEGPFRRLDGLYAVYGRVNAAARETVSNAIRWTLQEGIDDGLSGAALLDYFYFTERLRRWANPSARIGTLTPLATPGYVRAAFDQPPEAKLAESFHLEVIAELVPEWRGVSFYKASPSDTAGMTRPRLWQTGDAVGAAEILKQHELWDDVFDPAAMEATWQEVLGGVGRTPHETVLHRLIWRATYEEHLKVLGRAAATTPAAAGTEVMRADGEWMLVEAGGRPRQGAPGA